MTPLAGICLLITILGVLLIVLSVIPATAGRTAGGLGAGITLLIVGVALYVVLALFGIA